MPQGDPLISLLHEFKNELVALKTPDNSGPRSQIKTTTNMSFPKGDMEALEDLDSWLRGFDRVV